MLAGTIHCYRPRRTTATSLLSTVHQLIPLSDQRLSQRGSKNFLAPANRVHKVTRRITKPSTDQLLNIATRLTRRYILSPISSFKVKSVRIPRLSILLSKHPPTRPDNSVVTKCSAHQRHRTRHHRSTMHTSTLLQTHYRTTLRAQFAPQRIGTTSSQLSSRLAIVTALKFTKCFLAITRIISLVQAVQVQITTHNSNTNDIIGCLLNVSKISPVHRSLLVRHFLSPLHQILPSVSVSIRSTHHASVCHHVISQFKTSHDTYIDVHSACGIERTIQSIKTTLKFPTKRVSSFTGTFPRVHTHSTQSTLTSLPRLQASVINGLTSHKLLSNFLRFIRSLSNLPQRVTLRPYKILLSSSSLLSHAPIRTD